MPQILSMLLDYPDIRLTLRRISFRQGEGIEVSIDFYDLPNSPQIKLSFDWSNISGSRHEIEQQIIALYKRREEGVL